MFRFRVGKIPVEVQPSHFLVAAIFAYMMGQAGTEGGPGSGGLMVRTVAWVLIIFVSVLVHELGHALTSAGFGYQPAITLAWLGGHTVTTANGPIPWWKQVTLTLAGPLAGAALGVACGALLYVVPGPPMLAFVLQGFFFANLFWAVLNLMPVVPLDGSHIVMAVLQRVFGKPGFLYAQVIGLLAGIGLAVLAWNLGMQIGAIIFGMGAFDAFRLIGAYMRGEVPHDEAVQPHLQLIARAQHLAREGNLDDAEALVNPVLDADVPPIVIAHAHHLLGWIAVKKGDGRGALDHFAQVQRLPVEKEALAAAFSLIGDDGRAVWLWEQAYRDRRDPTILHEWAATLLRLGKEPEAARTGAELATAWRMAARTHFLRREFLASAHAATRALELRPSQQAAYDAACAFAQARMRDKAMTMLRRATALGFSDAGHALSDEDLEPIRHEPEFVQWVEELRQSASP